MKKFRQWIKLRENNGDQTHNMQPSGETPLAHATGAAHAQDPNAGGNADIEGLRKMVHTRMEKFLQELEGYHMPKKLAVQVLAQVAAELMQQTNMTQSQAKGAIAMGYDQNQGIM